MLTGWATRIGISSLYHLGSMLVLISGDVWQVVDFNILDLQEDVLQGEWGATTEQGMGMLFGQCTVFP